jgi:hypothetical protein
MKILTYYYGIVGILLIGCEPNNNKNRLIIQNESGYKVSSYIGHFLLSDSIFDTIGINRLKEVDEYFPESIHKKQKIKIFGEQVGDSLVTEFYSNGSIKKSVKSFGTNEVIETKSFSKDGNLVYYDFYDPIYNKNYRRNYENNKISDEMGKPFFSSYLNLTNNYFFEKDTIKAMFIAPTPPDCKASLFTLEGSKSYNNIHQVDSSSIFKVKIYPLKKGQYEWIVYLELKNFYTYQVSKSAYTRIKFEVK